MKIGQKAPEFDKLKKHLGSNKFLALYFYPKDNTPGCTKEACSLRNGWNELTKQGVSIIGVSPDSIESHGNFTKKYSLPFYLISDPNKILIKMYNAWGKKKLYGKEYEGVLRKTFIIDKNGVITHIIDKVDTENHAEQILNLLKNIKKEKKSKELIKKNMLVSDVISKYPEAAFVLTAYGLHCIGCVISDIDTIEQGAKSHGMDDKTIRMMIKDANAVIGTGLVEEEY